jgi:hypothetical protein
MKNIILQHFEPQGKNIGKPMPLIVRKSMENIKEYAESLGAEYKLLDGEPFQKGLRSQCQKCAAINEEYDEYDNVVVLDTDKFVTTSCTENIFNETGIACYGRTHKNVIQRQIVSAYPKYASYDYPIWGGAVYVMPREFRQLMRNNIDDEMRELFKKISAKPWVDEGIFHVLAVKAKFKLDHTLDEKWDYNSYDPHPETANMIHIRHRPKSREENYYDLVFKGIIKDNMT